MAGGAGSADGVVGDVGFVDEAVLREVHDRFGFFRREPVIGRQVFDDSARFLRGDGEAVEADHALERFLPTFRRGAFPGDAGEVAFLIFGVAGAALGDDERVCDGDAFFRFGISGDGCGPLGVRREGCKKG